MAEKNLVKDLEISLQTCISTLLSQDQSDSNAPNQTGLESTIEKFLESARNLEGYFAKFQMYSSLHHPEDGIREDILRLKEELARKETLLNSLEDKTIRWSDELDDLITKQSNMFVIEDRKT